MGNIETGKLISDIRKQKNMTQKDLSGFLNVSDKAVSKWERGESYPEVTVLPQLSDILGITVDELLSGNINPDTEEKISIDDSHIHARLCLLEDAQNKHYQSSIIAYLIIASGILICSALIPYYGINQIIGPLLCVTGIVYYIFSLNKFKTSLKRLSYYYNTDSNDTNFNKIKRYADLFIITTSLLLFLIIISCTFNDKLISSELIKNYWFLVIKYGGNIMVPIVLVFTAINLLIYCTIHKTANNNLSIEHTKLFWFPAAGTMLSTLSSFLLIGIKIYMILSSSHYNNSSFINVLAGIGIFNLAVNVILLFVFSKEKTASFIVFISNIIQYIIFAFGINKNIIYTKNLPSNVLVEVNIPKITITFMLILTIYHLTNLYIIKYNAHNKKAAEQ